tara:strand:+ start:532 stop:1485 length:954 start_codon:yes stop_codon:yes gene_type:complete
MKTLQEELNRNRELMGVIVEQAAQLARWFTKYLGREASEAMSKRISGLLTKRSTKTLADIADITIRNIKNIDGVDYLMSASGNKIDMKSISRLVDLTSQGLKNPDEWIKYLPRFTEDGSPYRHIMKQEMEALYKAAIASVEKSITIPTKLLGQTPKWVPYGVPRNDIKMFSGWKFHIFGETIEDAALIFERLDPILKKWGLLGKVGNEGAIKEWIGPALGAKQSGKFSTIYLNPNIIRAGMVDDLVDDIMRGLGDYKKTGKIYGDKSINGTLHYRYEFSKPIDVTQGVPEGHNLYVVNRGIYNIQGNPDLFDVGKLQ